MALLNKEQQKYAFELALLLLMVNAIRTSAAVGLAAGVNAVPEVKNELTHLSLEETAAAVAVAGLAVDLTVEAFKFLGVEYFYDIAMRLRTPFENFYAEFAAEMARGGVKGFAAGFAGGYVISGGNMTEALTMGVVTGAAGLIQPPITNGVIHAIKAIKSPTETSRVKSTTGSAVTQTNTNPLMTASHLGGSSSNNQLRAGSGDEFDVKGAMGSSGLATSKNRVAQPNPFGNDNNAV